MGELAGQLQSDSQFKGYGVTTGLGTSSVNADGTTNIGVGPDAGMQGSAGSLMGGAAGNFGAAAAGAVAASGNPAYSQAMQQYQQSAGNPMFGAAQNMISQGGSNAMSGQASNMLMQNAQNAAYGSAMGAQGSAMQGLSGQQQDMLSASQQAMMNAMGDTSGREQDIYNRAMSMQQPGLDAQRASQQAREYAQGRGGVRGSQFGGTAEDAATARAQAQAQNAASFQAMGQAQTEMMNQANMSNMFGQQGMSAAGLQSSIGNTMGGLGVQNAQLGQSAAGTLNNMGYQNAQLAQAAGGALGQLGGQQAQLGQSAAAGMGQLGQGQAQLGQAGAGLLANIAQGQGSLGNQMYQNSFMPLQQQLQAMQVAQGNASMAQTGQLTGAGYGAQLGLGGVQAQVNAEKAASELYGNLLGSGLTAISGMGQAGQGFFDTIKGLF